MIAPAEAPSRPAAINLLPSCRPLVDVSLWSGDLGALTAEVARMSRHADLFHIDVSDAHFVPGLLFFPDLVAALRQVTEVPFHVHLMAADPAPLAAAFAEAGADAITIHAETGQRAFKAVAAIRDLGRSPGVALTLETEPEAALRFLPDVDTVVMVGTPLGTKGIGLTQNAITRVAALRRLLDADPAAGHVRILADGGIRTHTVGPLLSAGADGVVAGSLLFGSPDPAGTTAWLHGHARRHHPASTR